MADFKIGDVVEYKDGQYVCLQIKQLHDKEPEYMLKEVGKVSTKILWAKQSLMKPCKFEYLIPVSYEMYGFAKITASSMEEAIAIFDETLDELPLPDESEYCDGSYHRDESVEDYVLYQS